MPGDSSHALFIPYLEVTIPTFERGHLYKDHPKKRAQIAEVSQEVMCSTPENPYLKTDEHKSRLFFSMKITKLRLVFLVGFESFDDFLDSVSFVLSWKLGYSGC